jgi:hypothetical protein
MAPDMQARNQTRDRYRTMASWFLCGMQGIIGLLHLYPPLAYRSVNATTTRVVATVNALGGLWVFALGLSAAALAGSLIAWHRLRPYMHLACTGVTLAYDVQLWVGALGDKPFGPLTFPVTFLLFVVGHLLLFFSYDGGD